MVGIWRDRIPDCTWHDGMRHGYFELAWVEINHCIISKKQSRLVRFFIACLIQII